VRVWTKEEVHLSKPKHQMNWNNKFEILYRCSSWFLKKKSWIGVHHVVENARSHGSISTTAWCTNCSNIPFSAYTAIEHCICTIQSTCRYNLSVSKPYTHFQGVLEVKKTGCSWIRASWYNYENNQQDALTYLLTYLLTPRSRVLLEKLTSKLCS
jgi:hypothetical protein